MHELQHKDNTRYIILRTYLNINYIWMHRSVNGHILYVNPRSFDVTVGHSMSLSGKRVTDKIRAIGVEKYLTKISNSAMRAIVNRVVIKTGILSGRISNRVSWTRRGSGGPLHGKLQSGVRSSERLRAERPVSM